MYADQLPGLLRELADAARGQSVIASSAIEGIAVEQARAERIVRGADQRLHVRSEQELAGYRDALYYLFRDDAGDRGSHATVWYGHDSPMLPGRAGEILGDREVTDGSAASLI